VNEDRLPNKKIGHQIVSNIWYIFFRIIYFPGMGDTILLAALNKIIFATSTHKATEIHTFVKKSIISYTPLSSSLTAHRVQAFEVGQDVELDEVSVVAHVAALRLLHFS
jgi:hypothetical protein